MPEPYDERSVQEIIDGCVNDDQAAYGALYGRFASGIYRLCFSLVLNKEDTEDIVQDSFVYAFKNLRRFDPGRASFKTWLYTIAVSRCRNLYRRKRFQLVDIGSVFGDQIMAPESDTPEGKFALSAAHEALARALAELAPRHREAIVLRYGHGLTFREIGEIMGCPPKTAESRVRAAHDQMRGLMHPVGRGILEEILSY